MPSKKPTFKKPREVIEYYEECTWLGNDTPMFQNKKVSVFYDRYPVVKGHLLFVPKKNDVTHVGEAYKLAFYCGEQWIKEGKMDGFNIGQNIGKAAGQSIMWPHVHLIPRHNGDCDKNTNNGIRLSHPKGDHKEYY
jgi:diadenosine tetraphosphate (Ap4A) HIT family hydrolase